MTETDRKMKVISSCLVPFYTVFTTEDTEDTKVNLVHDCTCNELFQPILTRVYSHCNEKKFSL